jgi:hypothetical protein
MIRYFLVLTIFLSTLTSIAQNESVKRNSVSLEIGGTGFLYSFNYDRVLLINDNIRFTANIGTWYIPTVENYLDFNIIGLTAGASTLFGKNKHFAEFGINFSYFYMRDFEDNIYNTILQPIRLGYRYQKDQGGLFLRASIMPIISVFQNKDVDIFFPVTPHISASIGYSF